MANTQAQRTLDESDGIGPPRLCGRTSGRWIPARDRFNFERALRLRRRAVESGQSHHLSSTPEWSPKCLATALSQHRHWRELCQDDAEPFTIGLFNGSVVCF